MSLQRAKLQSDLNTLNDNQCLPIQKQWLEEELRPYFKQEGFELVRYRNGFTTIPPLYYDDSCLYHADTCGCPLCKPFNSTLE